MDGILYNVELSRIEKLKPNFGFVMTNSKLGNQFYETAMTLTCSSSDERVRRVVLLYKVAITKSKSCASQQFQCPESG